MLYAGSVFSKGLSFSKAGYYMTKNAGVTTSKISFCDLQCGHADFARMDALDGSCRTFQSLWCKKLEKHVTKNAPCEVSFGKRRPTTGF
jgi:hypothetical protein